MDFVPDFQIAHIGVNLPDEICATQCAEQFAELFDLKKNIEKESGDACFTGPQIEWMKKPGRGKHGHIALETEDLPGAREYLEKRGFRFLNETAKYLPDGRILVLYAEQEIGGFAIHLMQKQKTGGNIENDTRME